jgi:septum formation protein
MEVRILSRAPIKNMKRKIILASTSARRKELLSDTGLKFETVSGNYKEDMTLPLSPPELAKFLSRGKAESVMVKYRNAIIISADTFVSFKGKIIGKPYTVKKATETLGKLSNQTHSIFTGFTIIDTKNSKTISKAVETKVSFRKLSPEMIKSYIKNKNPLEYAGAYTLRDVEYKFIKKIEGDPLNVIGLPVEELMKELKKFGVEAS